MPFDLSAVLVENAALSRDDFTPIWQRVGEAGQNLRFMRREMGVSKNRGTPKWMVYKGKPIKMDDLGGKPPYFWVDTQMSCVRVEGLSKCTTQWAEGIQLYIRKKGSKDPLL